MKKITLNARILSNYVDTASITTILYVIERILSYPELVEGQAQ